VPTSGYGHPHSDHHSHVRSGMRLWACPNCSRENTYPGACDDCGWRDTARNPIRFTGPSLTLMPFNPFQKFSIDLLGAGWDPTEKAKNPGPPAWAISAARDLIAHEQRVNPPRRGMHDVPEIEGMGHEERVQFYAKRIAAGVCPFTGEAPEIPEGMRLPYMIRMRRKGKLIESRDDFTSSEMRIPEPSEFESFVPYECPDCRRSAAYAASTGTAPRPCRACASGGSRPEPAYIPGTGNLAEAPGGSVPYGRGALTPKKTSGSVLRGLTGKKGKRSRRSTGARAAEKEAKLEFLNQGPKGGWKRDLAYLLNVSTVSDIARGSGLSRSALGKWLGGRTAPGAAHRKQIKAWAETVRARAKAMRNPPAYGYEQFQDLGREQEQQRQDALHHARSVTASRMVLTDQHLIDMLHGLIGRWPSQAKLAKQLGISKQHLTNILKGRRPHVDRMFYDRVMAEYHQAPRRAAPVPYPPRLGSVPQAHTQYHQGPPPGVRYGSVASNPGPPPGYVEHPELARLMNPARPRRRNRDARWKREPKEVEIDLDEAREMPGYDKAAKRYRRWHGKDPERAVVISVPNGENEVTRVDNPHVYLARRQQAPYVVDKDELRSQKNGPLWYHDYPENSQPRMVLNPKTGIIMDIGGSYLVDDYIYS
jgi:transcriptional regulator with XRE-family HTH domain